MEKLMTKKEIAEYLGISTITVDFYRKKKGMPFIKVGHKLIRFDVNEVKDWLKNHNQKKKS